MLGAGTGRVRVLFPKWVRNVVRVRIAFSKRSAYTGTAEKFGTGTGTGADEFQDIWCGYGSVPVYALRALGPTERVFFLQKANLM